MHTPENEPELFPELPDDENVQISDLDSPDAPVHPVTRFWRRFPHTSLSPHVRLRLTVITSATTVILLLVFLALSVFPTLNLRGTTQNATKKYVRMLQYPLEMSVANKVAYVTLSDGSIEALRLADGTPLWQYQPDAQPLQSPVISNGIAYFMTINENLNVPQGSIYAIRISDGKQLWIRTFASLYPGTPDVQQGIILVSAVNTLYGIRASDGSVAWKYDTGFLPPEYLILGAQDGRAYINSQFGDIDALDTQTGHVIWHYGLDKQHFSLPPQTVNGIVYATAQDGTLYAIQATTGRPLWHFNGTTGKNLAGALLTEQGNDVYLSTSDGTMNTIRVSDGKLLWQYKKDSTIWEAPVESGNTVYLSSQLGIIDALQVNTGKLLWHYKSSDTESAMASVDSQHVYIVSRDGVLNVLNVADGSLAWQYKEPSIAQGSPTVTSGVVLMTFSSGIMYALRESDGKMLWQTPISMFGSGFTFVQKDRVYVGVPQGGVSALRLSDGVQVWHYATP